MYADLQAPECDDAVNPKMDMLAAYTRQVDSELQICLDFLDLDELANFDLYVPIDIQPGGSVNFPQISRASNIGSCI